MKKNVPGDGGDDPKCLAVDPDPALDPYLLLANFSIGFELPHLKSTANLSSFQNASQIDSWKFLLSMTTYTKDSVMSLSYHLLIVIGFGLA